MMKSLLKGFAFGACLSTIALTISACSVESVDGNQTGETRDAQHSTIEVSKKLRPETIAAARNAGNVVVDDSELALMQDYIDNRNDPRIVTNIIKVDEDEVVDCVKFAQQHGFNSPSVSQGASVPPGTPAATLEAAAKGARQRYGTETARCPVGTIPRLHVDIDDITRFPTIHEYFRKTPFLMGLASVDGAPANGLPPKDGNLMTAGPTDAHQYAVVVDDVASIGGQSFNSLFSPDTELNSEFSLSQIWLTRGSGSDLQTVEAGWQVFVNKYGGSSARLFAFFTPDGYSSGCYNLDCTGFVQTNSTYTLGGSFANYSVIGSSEATAFIRVQMNATNDWWLAVNNVWLGYWPHSLFDTAGLANGAAHVEFGGEITDGRPFGRHTGTDMGSGYFSGDSYLYAAFHRSMTYYGGTTSSPTLNDISIDHEIVTGAACYDLAVDYDWSNPLGHVYMFFGGPGYSSACE